MTSTMRYVCGHGKKTSENCTVCNMLEARTVKNQKKEKLRDAVIEAARKHSELVQSFPELGTNTDQELLKAVQALNRYEEVGE